MLYRARSSLRTDGPLFARSRQATGDRLCVDNDMRSHHALGAIAVATAQRLDNAFVLMALDLGLGVQIAVKANIGTKREAKAPDIDAKPVSTTETA